MSAEDFSHSLYTGEIGSDGKTIKISAPAKINLFLQVTGKRADGYHDIYSWFQALALCDFLTIKETNTGRINLTTNTVNIPTDEKNLVVKAVTSIKSRFAIKSGFDINLDKNIPVGAGLGGGSSDAASTIRGLNKLLKLGLDRSEMANIGLEIGSDLPYFFSCGQAEVSGRGEIVKDIELPLDYRVILINPGFEISAAEAYRKLIIDLTTPKLDLNFRCCKQIERLIETLSGCANDLETALIASYPVLDKIRGVLYKAGAKIVRLTGSGPTMFALFSDKCSQENDLERLQWEKAWGLTKTSPVRFSA